MLVDSPNKKKSKPKSIVATVALPLPETPSFPKPDVLPKQPKVPDWTKKPDRPNIPNWPDDVPLLSDTSNRNPKLKKEKMLSDSNPEKNEQESFSEKSEKEPIEQPFSSTQGTGRRKSAIARVQLHSGTGHVVINKKRLRDYLQGNRFLIEKVLAPLKLVRFPLKEKGLAICVFVYGGGLMGQADAIQLGISRALCQYDKDYRRPFKNKGFLTRNARVKERKKYGLKKARKAPQYSKR
jgi:small subunit ribosomal protein S9